MSQPHPNTTPEGAVYEVFARYREDAMQHIGNVIAVDEELAKLYAIKLYDESSWDEMIIIPRADIQTIISPP